MNTTECIRVKSNKTKGKNCFIAKYELYVVVVQLYIHYILQLGESEVQDMKKYAVIVYYTFDPESEVYLFDTYEKACEYLKAMYDYCFKFAMEDEDFKEDESYCNDGYAQIKWGDEDNSMRIWQVTAVSEPMKIDGKDWN